MSNVSAYHLGRQVFTSNAPTAQEALGVIRHTGTIENTLQFDLADTVEYYRFIQLAPHSGCTAKVTLQAGLSKLDEVYEADEFTPLHIYFDEDITGIIIEAETVNGNRNPSIDLVVFGTDISTQPAVPPEFSGPWLVLDAAIGVELNVDTSTASWEDTRDERFLDQKWLPISVTEGTPTYIESDPDFNGAPSLKFAAYSSEPDRQAFKYSEAIGDMTGDKSPHFMRGDQDFTFLAVAWIRETNKDELRLFAASDSESNSPAIAIDPACRIKAFQDARFGTSTASDWLSNSSYSVLREGNEAKASLLVYTYTAANRTLYVYSQGEWKETVVYSGASAPVDFTDVPIVSSGGLGKVNQITVYKRALSGSEVNNWIDANAFKVDDSNNWKRKVMSGAANHFVPPFMSAYDDAPLLSSIAFDPRGDTQRLSSNFYQIDTLTPGVFPESTDDGFRTSNGSLLYIDGSLGQQYDQVEGDFHQFMCFTFHGQNGYTPIGTKYEATFGVPWGRDGHYGIVTPELNHVIVRDPSTDPLGFEYRYTVQAAGDKLPGPTPGTDAFLVGSDGPIAIGDTLAVVYMVNKSSETATFIIKNLTQGWSSTSTVSALNTDVTGPVTGDVVLGGWDRGNGTNRTNDFGLDATFHEITVRNDNLATSTVDEWFDYVEARWA